MAKKGKRGRRNGVQNARTMHAPTMQGMQQVDTWDLLDVVPVIVSSGSYVANEPAVVNFTTGPNRWFLSVSQGGSNLLSTTAAFGEETGQFSELATLWQTYRLDSVSLTFIPNNTGAGAQSSLVHAIATAGETIPTVPVDILEEFSRLRSMKISTAMGPTKRRIDYRQWLMQCTPQPFLQTLEPSGSGQRVEYPAGADNVAPLIRMAYQTVPGNISAANRLTIGVFRVDARYSVRGRRSTSIPLPIKIAMMTAGEREEMLQELMNRQKYPVPKVTIPSLMSKEVLMTQEMFPMNPNRTAPSLSGRIG